VYDGGVLTAFQRLPFAGGRPGFYGLLPDLVFRVSCRGAASLLPPYLLSCGYGILVRHGGLVRGEATTSPRDALSCAFVLLYAAGWLGTRVSRV
jgi:hypothetical protein